MAIQRSSKEETASVLLIILSVITAISPFITQVPDITERTALLLSTISVYIVGVLTVWRQQLSEEINSKIIWIAVAIMALNGLNDVLNVASLPLSTDKWIRFIAQLALVILSLISKTAAPTPKTISKI